jgi:AcrR family transcriptional regulator
MSVTAITVARYDSHCHHGYDLGMVRWEPDAAGRLAKAAMELYSERGFDATTVAEIAERAGLTERTFFRHYADKREVLFAGASQLQELLVRRVEEAPAAMPPMEVMATALAAVATEIFAHSRHDFARQRQAIIVANADLRERELIKLAALGDAAAAALRRRGVTDPAASLAAEAGIAVFRVAFERWVSESGDHSLAQLITDSMSDLRVVTAGE